MPQAAKYFVYVSASAMRGRVLVALIGHRVPRRPVGIVFGFAALVALGFAGYFHSMLIAGFPLFVVLIAASAFFVEGGIGNIAPYTIEQYGVRLGSRASGLGRAAAGVGKTALALIAGTCNLVQPQATSAAVFPALLFPGCQFARRGLCVHLPGGRDPWKGDGARPGGGAGAHRVAAAGEQRR